MNVLYVYYKVAVAQHAELGPRVRRFQASLLDAYPGLACELLQRPMVSDGDETWMETYRHTSALTEAMIKSIAQRAQLAGLPAPRHSEVFIPLN